MKAIKRANLDWIFGQPKGRRGVGHFWNCFYRRRLGRSAGIFCYDFGGAALGANPTYFFSSIQGEKKVISKAPSFPPIKSNLIRLDLLQLEKKSPRKKGKLLRRESNNVIVNFPRV